VNKVIAPLCISLIYRYLLDEHAYILYKFMYTMKTEIAYSLHTFSLWYLSCICKILY